MSPSVLVHFASCEKKRRRVDSAEQLAKNLGEEQEVRRTASCSSKPKWSRRARLLTLFEAYLLLQHEIVRLRIKVVVHLVAMLETEAFVQAQIV